MGTRFRKSIKIAPGVKINVGKKSVGLSVGGKGAGMTFNSKTGTRARVSVPGTGLSYSTKIGGKKKVSKGTKSKANNSYSSSDTYIPPEGPLFSFRRSWLLYLALVLIAVYVATDGAGITVLGILIAPLAIIVWAAKSAGDALLKHQSKKDAAAQAQKAAISQQAAPEEVFPYEHIAFRLVGVTFKNDDGSSRQSLLRKIKYQDPPFDTGTVRIELTEYSYKGEPALKVEVNGYQVGDVPKNKVPEILDKWERIDRISNFEVVGGGRREDGEWMNYGAEVTVRFFKEGINPDDIE